MSDENGGQDKSKAMTSWQKGRQIAGLRCVFKGPGLRADVLPTRSDTVRSLPQLVVHHNKGSPNGPPLSLPIKGKHFSNAFASVALRASVKHVCGNSYAQRPAAGVGARSRSIVGRRVRAEKRRSSGPAWWNLRRDSSWLISTLRPHRCIRALKFYLPYRGPMPRTPSHRITSSLRYRR